ncbi:MAG: peptidase [Bacteroidetes bacterium 43-93]|nr:BtrH N-terminal domain-containing protein [Bacteroidota bacterium]OJW95806.1 MAG: peptidase [Bacteroidetes bacterium 43-93]
MSIADYKHYQHAHCESGVTANLLRHEGVDISEPLAFGIGAGMFFGHLPFLKVSGTPGTTFRTWPGAIFKRATQRLGITMHTQRFPNPQKAMKALDDVLATGKPVGMLSSVYYLPYLPEAFRFHFNAHNLVVYGKENEEYYVSDPVLEQTTRIAPEDLAKARFAKGAPEPKGFMYYVKSVPKEIHFEKAIQSGIKQTCFFMLSPPVPWFGNKAIFLLANKIQQYPKKLTPRKASLYLGNIIRMQEEIGTGGAGFRFLYAAFLQEAANILKRDDLQGFSQELTLIGDDWRNFAYNAARVMKDRKEGIVSFDELADMLRICGEKEKDFFKRMQKLKW